jgi:hypothetical protein
MTLFTPRPSRERMIDAMVRKALAFYYLRADECLSDESKAMAVWNTVLNRWPRQE